MIGVGSQTVGCTTSTGNRWISLACQVCFRCGGAGRKADEKHLCHICRGAGARAFGLFVSGENCLTDAKATHRAPGQVGRAS